MDVYEVVEKLIGPVSPVGETHTDNARFENLKELIELTDRLVGKISSGAYLKDRSEFSISRAGKSCQEFLDNLKDCLQDQDE